MMGNASDRTLRWVAIAIVGALGLALACYWGAWWLRLAALFAMPMRAFGAAHMHFTPEQYAASTARAASLQVWAMTLTYLSLALLAASTGAIMWCARQTWAAVKRWHWCSFAALAFLFALMVFGHSVGTSKPPMLGLLALDAVSVACVAIDLARRQYGTPGRVVAWTAGIVSVGLGTFLWIKALGPNGIIGRWLSSG